MAATGSSTSTISISKWPKPVSGDKTLAFIDSTPRLASFIAGLAGLSSRARLDFARWCANDPSLNNITSGARDKTPAGLPWGMAYVARCQAQALARDTYANLNWDDGTVSSGEGVTFFDPCLPDGWQAWHTACATIAAMAGALLDQDQVALASLAPAFAWLSTISAGKIN